MLGDLASISFGLELLTAILVLLSLATAFLFNLLTPKLVKNFITKEDYNNRLQVIDQKLVRLEEEIMSTQNLYDQHQEILIAVKKDVEWIKEAIQNVYYPHRIKK